MYQGDRGDEFFILIKGTVSIFIEPKKVSLAEHDEHSKYRCKSKRKSLDNFNYQKYKELCGSELFKIECREVMQNY